LSNTEIRMRIELLSPLRSRDFHTGQGRSQMATITRHGSIPVENMVVIHVDRPGFWTEMQPITTR
jgi:hypothetical protein